MNTRKSHLGFELPVVDEDLETKLDVTPEGVARWCESLPKGETGHVAKEVYFALLEVLQTEIEYHDLFAILNTLQTPISSICQDLKKHYVGQTKPLDSNKLIIVNLGQSLQINLMMGYKHVIEYAAGDIDDSKTQEIIMSSISKVLDYTNSVLTCSYQLYAVPTPNFWRELYILYTFANNNNLLEVSSPEDDSKTLGDKFKRIFLFSATNPYQWRQSEQDLIANVLPEWENFVALRKTSKKDFDEPGIFVLDLDSDHQPDPATLRKISYSNTCLSINLIHLADHLKEVLDEFRVNGEKETRAKNKGKLEYNIPTNSLRILSSQWARPILRKSERVRGTGEVEAVFGYEAVHYFVNQEKEFNLTNLDNVFSGKASNSTGSKNKDHSAYMCKVLDTSKQGSRILWSGGADAEMSPGRLVGFKRKDSLGHSPWSLGVVIWIKNEGENDLVLGLEHLDGFAEASAFRLEKDGKAEGNFSSGFMLPKLDKLDNHPTVIVSQELFDEKDTIKVSLSDDNMHDSMTLTLQQQVYEAMDFKQFEFTINDLENVEIPENIKRFEPPTDSQSNQDSSKGLFGDQYDSKFDSIWGDL